MRRFLFRNAAIYTRSLLQSSSNVTPTPRLLQHVPCIQSRIRLYSSESDESNKNTDESAESAESALPAQLKKKDGEVQDVSNKELKEMIFKYFNERNDEVLPSIMESILHRKLLGKHEETDDEWAEEVHELRTKPLDKVEDEDFESDFEELYKTDEEIHDLYNAEEHVVEKMVQDEYFNMDNKKWDAMIKEAMQHGYIEDTKNCEEILEDMLHWDKLLPDDLKKKVEKKFNELGDRCESGELEPEEAYVLFKQFEDEMVTEYGKSVEADGLQQFDETRLPDRREYLATPTGEGPILRWKTRVVFAPGGDAWHPKNRKVKLSVTVKELGLSRYQFRRLRELVGKRYHPGKDELTITSERFEYREENRKDCLRTLFSLIEESQKADKIVEDTTASYVKDGLRANPAFMDRLKAKITTQGSNTVPA